MLHSPGGAAPDVATIQMRIAEMEQELARGPNQEHALVVPNPRHAAQLQERIAWARQVAQTPPISPEEARAARLTRDATRAAEAAGGGGMGMMAPDGSALASRKRTLSPDLGLVALRSFSEA